MTTKYLASLILLTLLGAAGSVAAADFTDPTTGMEFVLVKGGCYQLGDATPAAKPDETEPAPENCVSDFYLGKHEVTQAQYLKVVGNKASDFKGVCPDCPVVNVTFEDAKKFTMALSRESQLSYRLPYEDEWEFAARNRGGGEKWPGTNGSVKLAEYAWYQENSDGKAHPVGEKRPNRLGIYDLGGNVAEWCEDVYSPVYGEPPAQMDTVLRRTIRGGSWRDAPDQLLAVRRSCLKPILRPAHKATSGTYDVDVGFRVVLPAEKLRLSKLYLGLAANDGAKVADTIRKLKNKPLPPRAQGELVLAAIDLLPGQNLSREIEALIKIGADVNVRDEMGSTPLVLLFDRAFSRICCDATGKEHDRADNLAYKLASLLIEAGADVNARDSQRRTALTLAAAAGASKSVRLLLDNQADVNIADLNMQTPLMQAGMCAKEYVTKSPETSHGWEEEVLVPKIRGKYQEIVKRLHKAGADLALRDSAGKTALDHAQECSVEVFAAMGGKSRR